MIGKSLLAAAVLALGLAAPKAHAVVIYDWTGSCAGGCTGPASAVLTLEDTYVPGTEVMDADFISFSYSASSGAYAIPTDAALTSVAGSAVLPAVSGEADLVLLFTGGGISEFRAIGDGWGSSFPPVGLNDIGSEALWTLRRASQLSAPGPLSLLALGLAGLALAGRRRGKAATGGRRCGALPAGEDRP